MKTKDYIIIGLAALLAYLWWKNKTQPAQTSVVFTPVTGPNSSVTTYDPNGNIITSTGIGTTAGVDTSSSGLPLGQQYSASSGANQTFGPLATPPNVADPGWVGTLDPNNPAMGITGWTLVDNYGNEWSMNNIGSETNPVPDPSSITWTGTMG